MSALRRRALALAVFSCACGSFDAAVEPSATDGGADGSDARWSCPTDAVVCHSFDRLLVEGPWVADGRTKGSGALVLASEGDRSFARATVASDPLGVVEDRLKADLGARPEAIEVAFDLRVTDTVSQQAVEVATIAHRIDASTFHFFHVHLFARKLMIAEYVAPAMSYTKQPGNDLPPGWHRIGLRVDWATAVATMTVDGADPIRKTFAVTAPGTVGSASVNVGLNHSPEWFGPFVIDVDSVAVFRR